MIPIPTAGINHEGIAEVSACLRADGHPLLSTLMHEFVWQADDARRREIEALVWGAIWSTLHLWV